MTYCPKCGFKNDDDAENCAKCGASLKMSKFERRGGRRAAARAPISALANIEF